MKDDTALGPQLMASMLRNLDRPYAHIVLLGCMSSRERVASFLLDLAERRSEADQVDLAMTRMDIADHLGLTLETVSRVLSLLAQGGLIRIVGKGRAIKLAHKAKLRMLAELIQ